jgi:hypothetical protein
MTTIAIPTEKVEVESEIKVFPLDEVAETIRDDALALAQARLSAPLAGLELNCLLRHPDFVDNLKYGLASGVSNALSANNPRVTAVYIYEPSANPDSELGNDMPVDATVHLLVLVKSSSAALEAFIAALDRALTASLTSLPSLKFAEHSSILDVNLLTEKDVASGRGYAVLLSSVFAPPLKVWQR